uniref:Uncharacterized protein n=1 Tax=Candidatus Kentrum eta TaxID=2126337 RepID=A0A450V8G9_9GAMM|nr:MAG: hypothetical protein BECKH772A_GA0070896_100628 [Candidatus Kentron sp. H]VFJ94562.1 MAG: hypothetical protein BECKH772B_GA0070898_100638 [Candidatus Kentron sp. H]VFK01103.1 MAG: hypothetical protein BECKH772C_GA0070978_100588 [Candidatus Kentron sp. H]
MSDKKEMLREEIERHQREIDELKRRDRPEDSKREIYDDATRMQAPEPWPDPPEDNSDKG